MSIDCMTDGHKRSHEGRGIHLMDAPFQSLIRELLIRISEDPDRPGLKNTPARVTQMYGEIFKGYNSPLPILTNFPNGEDGVKIDEMITDSGYFFSHCEHHMVPFFGQYHFAYIPNKTILGLSKVARTVDHFAAKLQVQERLTEEIVNYIDTIIKPKGIALVMKGRHLCKEMRGVKKINGEMTTSVLRGAFKKRQEVRMEFFQLCRL